MLSRIREICTVILLCILPFHAFMVTVLTRLLYGQFKDTPLWLSLWKEGVLLLLLAILSLEILRVILRSQTNGLRRLPLHSRLLTMTILASRRMDRLDYLIIAFTLLALLVSLATNTGLKHMAFGVKYDIWPLLLFFFFRRVTWSEEFKKMLLLLLLVVGVFIAGIGFVFMVIPASFLEWFGYSETHSLYMAHKPVAGFQQIGGTELRRLQSVLSGPNQAGIWLLIPLSIVWVQLLCIVPNKFTVSIITDFIKNNAYLITSAVVIIVAIIASFSRSAWLATLAIFFIGIWQIVPKIYRKKFLGTAVALIVAVSVLITLLFPAIIVRQFSSSDHIRKPLEAVQTIIDHPFGLGLGSAGPASNQLSNSCTTVESADIAWTEPYPELCVFLGAQQIKPLDRTCNCPRITENWYLQIAVETGLFGGILFLMLIISVLLRFKKQSTTFAQAAFFMCIGVAIAALFLHAWEDSAIAYTVWIIAAMALPTLRTEEPKNNVN